MGFFGRFWPPRDVAAPELGVQVLAFAPAVVRLSVAGKDTKRELEALADAVATLGFPQGFSSERVFAAASEMGRMIRIEGVEGISARMTTELGPEEKAASMRLALVAALASPLRDSGDIGILSRIAGLVGMSKSEFDALHEASKAFA